MSYSIKQDKNLPLKINNIIYIIIMQIPNIYKYIYALCEVSGYHIDFI